MNATLFTAIISSMLIFASPAISEDLGQTYPESKLIAERTRLQSKIEYLYEMAILPILPDTERIISRRIAFEFPLFGPTRHPLEFHSERKGDRQVVVFPVFSLLFLEDVCTAYAWLWAEGYTFETIRLYFTLLEQSAASEFSGQRLPPPLKALQIPDDALSDPDVDDLSLRLRNTAYAFVLLHHLGAGLSNHDLKIDRPEGARASPNSIAVADRFALDFLQRVETIPMGIMPFFEMQTYMLWNKAPLSLQEPAGAKSAATVVLPEISPARFSAMGEILLGQSETSDDDAVKEVMHYLGKELLNLAELVEQPDILAYFSLAASCAELASLDPREFPTDGNLLEAWCHRSH